MRSAADRTRHLIQRIATMVAVVRSDGGVVFVNAMFENTAGLSRRTLMRSSLFDWFTDDEVKQALEDLPENFRLPVLLADVEEFSYKEIAEMLDIPIGTVMSRLHRGRKAMQEMLYEYAKERGLVDEALLDPQD